MNRAFALGIATAITLHLALLIVASMPARAQGLPDLTADGWLDHEPVIEGHPYALSLAVRNLGDAPAGNFTVLLQYSGSSMGIELLQIPESDPLSPQETRIVRRANFTGSQGIVGFGITVDYYGVIAESDEANNQVSRSWDGISPHERPISRIAISGTGTEVELLSPESTRIYTASLGSDDVLRYRVTGREPTQPFDVFLFFGETNLNTYFGFGDFHPELQHRGVTVAEAEFRATRSDFVYLVVDNLSDGPQTPWPQLLNVTLSIEILRVPPTQPSPLTSQVFMVGALGAAAVTGGIVIAVLFHRKRKAPITAAAAEPPSSISCPSCGSRLPPFASFCDRCGGRMG